jgi:stage II sporulation protein D
VIAVLLALALVAGSAPAARADGTIRVALLEGVRSIELLGQRIEVRAGEGCCARAWRTEVVRAGVSGAHVDIDGRRAAAFRLRSEAPIRVNGRDHVGPLDLVRHGPGLAVISEVPLEEYVAGVVRAEVGERWPLEALRAQAVAVRTYAAYHRQLNAAKPFHILASTAHQQYAGRVAESSVVWSATQETAGQVLRLDGQLFPAFYHTESGGHTEEPGSVFAARNMPPLRAVVCPHSTGSPHYAWSLELPLPAVAEALRRGGTDVGDVTEIEVPERTVSQRALTVAVRGTRGTASLRGNDFRRLVGYDTLKSTLFTVATERGVVRFTGRGYGHGVGLCQWGARGMAEQGYTMVQILEFYYPGAVLAPLRGR